jgi:hypothetical protein
MLALFVTPAMAQHPPWHEEQNQQSSGGGTTNQITPLIASNPAIIMPDTFTEPSPMVDTGAPPPALGVGGGLTVLWSSHIQAYVLPVSYMINPNLKMEASIPYLRKKLKGEVTNEDLKADGLGDISLGIKYRYGTEENLQGVTTMIVKLPTGDYKKFENRTEQLALGSGSYDFSINQTVSKRMGPYRILANLGYRMNTENDYVETDVFGRNVCFESKAGNTLNYLLGLQYQTPVKGLVGYVNTLGIIQARSRIKETVVSDGSLIRDGKMNDRLRTLDLNLGAMLMITPNMGARLGVFIPTLTDYDDAVRDRASREWVLDFGFTARF